MKKKANIFVTCEVCERATTIYQAKWTINIIGDAERHVCPACYDRVMRHGYDEQCAYQDEEFALTRIN